MFMTSLYTLGHVHKSSQPTYSKGHWAITAAHLAQVLYLPKECKCLCYIRDWPIVCIISSAAIINPPLVESRASRATLTTRYIYTYHYVYSYMVSRHRQVWTLEFSGY